MKHTIIVSLVILLIGYYLGIKFPAVGTQALSKVGM